MRHRNVLLPALIAAGCMNNMHDAYSVPDVMEMPASPERPHVPSIADEDPAEDVVEVSLVAAPMMKEWVPGRPTTAWGYNGSIPGPLIEAKVGDRVVVHFRNDLDEPTSIHWHGVRVPAAMDGGPDGPLIAPGEQYDFEFEVPDAGLFWYHPHERSSRQVEMGLHGPILVRGEDEPSVDVERVLVFDDVLVDDDGRLAPFSDASAVLGRQGNVVVVGGVAHPTISLRAGTIERWRVVNVANARYFQLDVPGHTLRLAGTDGGLLADSVEIERPVIAPGERIDVLVRADGAPGSAVDVSSLPYDRGRGMGHMNTDWGDPTAVLRLSYASEPAAASPPWPDVHGKVEVLSEPVARDELVLGEEHCTHDGDGCGVAFTINGERWPDVTPLHARLGETRRWVLINDGGMDHPFHLHGFRFQVVRLAGRSPSWRAWKDTVNVPAGDEVEVLVSFDGAAGSWAHHCHILEHAENGMMGLVNVAP